MELYELIKDAEDIQELADALGEAKAVFKLALKDIKDKLKELAPGSFSRADSYWLAHMLCQLDHDHSYMAREMCTMQDTIDELRQIYEEE